MPEAKQVAVISTSDWKIIKNIDLPAAPYNVKLQADGQHLWVDCQGDASQEEKNELAVIDVNDLNVKKLIPIGNGAHELLIRPDDRFVYVTNKEDNELMVIDGHNLNPITQVSICQQPSSMAYSQEAQAIYVISEETGELSVIDAELHTLSNSIQLEPGVCQIKFEPNERYAFVVNSSEDNISIIDASINKVVQVGDMESEPDQVNFTEGLAYVRHRNSELVLMIPLANIGNENTPVTVVDFPGGQYPPGRMSKPSLASGIVQTPGESAVLIANAPDKTIYYYSEGMAAPMGNFSNYNQEPRAVMVIDRSLQEVEPGVYETVAKLRSPGLYDIAFFMDVPRFIHCFSVNILPDPKLGKKRSIERLGALKVSHLLPRRFIIVGEKFPINFDLFDQNTNQKRSDLLDVQIMCMGGSTHFRKTANVQSDGSYSANVIFREPGVYYMYVGTESGGLVLNNPQYRTLHVKSVDGSTK